MWHGNETNEVFLSLRPIGLNDEPSLRMTWDAARPEPELTLTVVPPKAGHFAALLASRRDIAHKPLSERIARKNGQYLVIAIRSGKASAASSKVKILPF